MRSQRIVRGNCLGYQVRSRRLHARIDVLEIQKMASAASPQVIQQAFDDYLELGAAFDGLYYVDSVTDELKPGEYKQRFTLTRNGLVSTLPTVPA